MRLEERIQEEQDQREKLILQEGLACRIRLEELMQEEATKIVKRVVAYALNKEEEEIVPEASLTRDLGMVSMDAVDIQLKLEEELEIPQLYLFTVRSNKPIYGFCQAYHPEIAHQIKTELAHFYNAMPPSAREEFDRTSSPTVFAENLTVRGLIAYVMNQLIKDAEEYGGGE